MELVSEVFNVTLLDVDLVDVSVISVLVVITELCFNLRVDLRIVFLADLYEQLTE